ncbi:MAG: hypothetical protein ACJZ4I_03750 [Candidatus Pelagibacter sp.]
MLKKFTYFTLFLLIIVSLSIFYLSYFGIKTDKFNNNISNQLKKNYPNLEIKFKEIKLLLNPINLLISVETENPIIFFEKKEIKLNKISTNYNIISFFKKEFGINTLNLETKNNEIKDIVKLLRLNKDTPQLYILDKTINKGKIFIEAKINFDEKGNIKNDFKISGKINNLYLKLLNKNEIKDLNLNFNYYDKNLDLKNINLSYFDLKISSENISLKKNNKFYIIKGKLKNSRKIIPKEIISLIFKNENLDKVILSSENDFSFKINKKYKISDLSIKSKVNLDEANFKLNNKFVKNYIPDFENKFKFINHVLDIKYKKSIFIKGNGKVEIGNKKEEIEYNLNFIDDKLSYELVLFLNKALIKFDLINLLKKENVKSKIRIKGKNSKNIIEIEKISLDANDIEISADNFELTNNFKIINFGKINLNYIDKYNKKNDLIISKTKKEYVITGKEFDISNIVDEILKSDDEDTLKLFDKKNRIFQVDFDKNYIDKEHYLVKLKGKFKIKNNDLYDMDFNSKFSNNKNLSLSIKTKNNNKVTTFFSDFAKPFVKKYKFIKGFEEGKIDFSSMKKNKISNSKLKIYDFKLKELPALTKILTLASLQGIADILSGEGVRFDDFEMNFQNKKDLMEIKEIYAIGPAISILMDGYVQGDDLVSLRGTLVPATTVNKFVGSIPILGDILVGKKTGEGVFGVSFKIKGPPKDLKTTVNPIKTLTPRFITRTLEKIKKTN